MENISVETRFVSISTVIYRIYKIATAVSFLCSVKENSENDPPGKRQMGFNIF